MTHIPRLTAVAMGLLITGFAQTAAAGGDVEAGKVKAYTCLGCHGVKSYDNVYPSYKVPMIGGQHAAYLEAALKAYRDKQRSHPTMQAQAGSLSDEDIADLAAYFEARGQ